MHGNRIGCPGVKLPWQAYLALLVSKPKWSLRLEFAELLLCVCAHAGVASKCTKKDLLLSLLQSEGAPVHKVLASLCVNPEQIEVEVRILCALCLRRQQLHSWWRTWLGSQ